MIIVGELINSSRKVIPPLIEGHDAAAIQDLARRQMEAGATFVDVNAGTFVAQEIEHLSWLVTTVQAAVDAPLCIDSPNPAALEKALTLHRGKAMVNSITAEKARYNTIVPLVKKYKTAVVALCMDDRGMPESAAERVAVARELGARLQQEGIPLDDVYFDPLVRPVSTDPRYGTMMLDTTRGIKEHLPQAHVICGLSNVSFGLPLRKLLNQNFLVMAMTCGLDAVIIDPLDARIMSNLYATAALLGKDEYCMNYIARHRDGKIQL
jgi:5-methyltetrahydrofolate--homocysteine methyltransferase